MAVVDAAPVKVPTERYSGCAEKRDDPGYYPFISHLTFRNMCDKVIDDCTEWFDPEEVQQGDIIYINIWYLDWFEKVVHDRIKFPYILVSGDVGAWEPHPELKRLLYDPKLAAWFCRNMVFSYHPKLFQIPMGQDLALFTLGDFEIKYTLLGAIKNKKSRKDHLLYMNHYPRRHGDRDLVVKLFENETYCLSRNNSSKFFDSQLPRDEFYKEMATCQFVLSPLGLETDSVRTWEALVLDCIPIVEHTFLDASYDNLPVVMVHDWKEINPVFLEKKYQDLKDRKLDEAYFDYWHDLIKDVQKKVRNDDLSFAQLEATKFSSSDLDDLAYILRLGGVLDMPLFYKGFLSSLRPLQLTKKLNSHIFLYDSWLDYKVFDNLVKYLKDISIYQNIYRIFLLSSEKQFCQLLTDSISPCSIFLDLTYYRTSLFINFQTSVIEYGNLRQSLKQDLTTLYDQLLPSSFLCGNMVNNDYVKEILEKFSNEIGMPVMKRGSFWYIIKR